MKERILQSWRYILAGCGLLVLTWLVIGFNSRMAELRQRGVEAKSVDTTYQALLATEAALDEQIAFATSDAAVEKWAYEEAHWVREGDHPIGLIPLEGEAQLQPERLPEAPARYENWQVWLALFFDRSSFGQNTP